MSGEGWLKKSGVLEKWKPLTDKKEKASAKEFAEASLALISVLSQRPRLPQSPSAHELWPIVVETLHVIMSVLSKLDSLWGVEGWGPPICFLSRSLVVGRDGLFVGCGVREVSGGREFLPMYIRGSGGLAGPPE